MPSTPSPAFPVYRNIPRPPADLLARFAPLGTADVADSLPPEALLDQGLKPLWPGSRMIGPAITALNRPGDTLMLHYAVDACQPGDVLVIASDGPGHCALWGKMVTISAQARGAAGALVDGLARDAAAVRESGFPVWARGLTPRGGTRSGPGTLNQPILCGETPIYPGDVIFADDDGVLVIPRHRLEDVLEAGLRRLAAEEKLLPALRAGASTFALLGLDKAAREAGLEEQPGLP